MFFRSKKPYLTLFFSCEHCVQAHKRVHVQEYFKCMMYIKIYVFGSKNPNLTNNSLDN